MTDHITLEMIDADGAIQEAADAADLSTRSDFFRKSIYAGGTLAAGGLLMGGMPALAGAKPSARQDIKILNFALTLSTSRPRSTSQATSRQTRCRAQPATSPRSSQPSTSTRTSCS